MFKRLSALPVAVALIVLTTTTASSTATIAGNDRSDNGSINVVSARDGLGCC